MMKYGKGMRHLAGATTLFILSGCANYLALRDKNSLDYRLGSTPTYAGILPHEGLKQIEENLCGPKAYAMRIANASKNKRVFTDAQAKDFASMSCFNRSEDLMRFGAQRLNKKLTEALSNDTKKLQDFGDIVFNESNKDYNLEVEYGMSPEGKLVVTGIVLIGIGNGIAAAAGAFAGGGGAKAAPIFIQP